LEIKLYSLIVHTGKKKREDIKHIFKKLLNSMNEKKYGYMKKWRMESMSFLNTEQRNHIILLPTILLYFVHELGRI
jgi:hypothetical protein